jgi:hypothetical protein
MTRSQLALSHASVFAVGIAVAVVTTRVRSSDQETQTDSLTTAQASRSSSRTPGTSGTSGDSRAENNRDRNRQTSAKFPTDRNLRLSEIVKITDALARQRALIAMIDTLGPEQFAAIAAQFRQLDHLGNTQGEMALILQGWAKLDPLAALKHAAEHDDAKGRRTVLEAWASTDAAAAEAWAKANSTGEGANSDLAAVVSGLAGNDLAAATRLIQSMPKSRERGDAARGLTNALLQQGPDAAKAYPASIKDDSLRAALVGMIANRLAAKNPADTAKWLTSLPDGQSQDRAARDVATALANQDLGKATAWLTTLKPEARAAAACGIIPVMSYGDPAKITQTANWVASLAGTPSYDSMVEEFVWSCNSRSPEQSAAWIQGVANVKQQRRLYHRMLGEWQKTDPAAVKQWVSTNAVPEDVSRRFLK